MYVYLEPRLVLQVDLEDTHAAVRALDKRAELLLEGLDPVRERPEARVAEGEGDEGDLSHVRVRVGGKDGRGGYKKRAYLLWRLRQERLELVRDAEEGLGLEGREAAGLVDGDQLLVRLEQLSVCDRLESGIHG